MTRSPSLLCAAVSALILAAPRRRPAGRAGRHPGPDPAPQGDLEAESFVQNQASRVSAGAERPRHGAGGQEAGVPDHDRSGGGTCRASPASCSVAIARTVTPAQYAAFSSAFREYADNVYESRLGQYSGQTLRVTGSIVRQPGDVVVSSQISGGSGRADGGQLAGDPQRRRPVPAPSMCRWRACGWPSPRSRISSPPSTTTTAT